MKHHALTDKARSLVSHIGRLEIELLETLNAIFAQQVYKTEGYDSMHAYCTACLEMSGDQAYRRLQAARLMQRHPVEVREMLETGEAKLTHLAMIESVVTRDNAADLFNEVRGKSTREVERMLRREDPKPDVTEAVTHVAAPRIESVELLAPDRWALRAMMNDETKAVFDEVVNLLSPGQRNPGEVVRRALIELRERLLIQKRRTRRSAAKPAEPTMAPAAAPAPSPSPTPTPTPTAAANDNPPGAAGEHVGPTSHTRYVPAAIARAVYERDNYCCQFVGDSGRICGSKRNLQLHHLDPWSRGGATTIDNLRVYCRCHNLYQAELDFGPRKAA